MKTNGMFDKHRPKLLWEAILRSALCGITSGFIAAFVAAFVAWLTPGDGLWLILGVFAGVSVLVSVIFYFVKYRPDDMQSAKRLDGLGLHERLVTMVEYQDDSSSMATMQREDARRTLAKLDPRSIKILIPRAIVVALIVSAIVGSGMTTVNALADNGVIKGGDDLIDEIVDEQTTEYVTVSYVIEEGGIFEGDEDQILVKGTDATTITAVADEGYVFKEWSDGYTSPTRTDTEVMEDVVYTAIFLELGDGNGDGGDGDGEGEEGDQPQDAPSEESQDGNSNGNPSEGTPGEGMTGGGNIQDPVNLIINNSDYYRDIINKLNEGTTERIEGNDGSLSQTEIDMIKKYLGIV